MSHTPVRRNATLLRMSEPDPAVGEIFEGYLLEAVIGEGSRGTVFKALAQDGGEQVALVLLRSDASEHSKFRARFLAEADAASRLDDPAVLATYEVGGAGGRRLFVAVQLVAGGDLRSILERDGAVPVSRAVGIVCEVAGALQAADEAGLRHRYVKPGHVLVDDDQAYLGDFGYDRIDMIVPDGHTEPFIYLYGTITPPEDEQRYYAPEQWRGEDGGPRSYVYVLGQMLLELLSGQPPPRALGWVYDVERGFHELDHDLQSLAYEHVLDPALGAVLRQALAGDPAERHPTPAALAAALAGLEM